MYKKLSTLLVALVSCECANVVQTEILCPIQLLLEVGGLVVVGDTIGPEFAALLLAVVAVMSLFYVLNDYTFLYTNC